MQSFRIIVLFVVSFTAAVFAIAAMGQTPASQSANSNWETLRPEGEEFAVQMPKGSSAETSKELYHKMELNTRTYLSQAPNGPVLAVVSMSGIKSNPALYTEMQRVNSYVDAFKKLFTPKLKKTAPVKLEFVKNRQLMGHVGREYRMSVGDLSGTVHAFATRKRFYAVVYLNTKKDEAIQDEFFTSFALPEKIEAEQPPPPVAQNPPTPAQGTKNPNANPSEPAEPATPTSDTSGNTDAKPTTAATDPATKPPVPGGVLNGKAITLPKPQHPAEARDTSGTVVVNVTIDEYGNVSSARAVSGPPALQQAAINAALQARFSPTVLMGEPVKVTGVITYNFVKP